GSTDWTGVPAWAAFAIARRSRLETRVSAILDDTRSRSLSWQVIGAIVPLGALTIGFLGTIRVSAAGRDLTVLPTVRFDVLTPYSPLIPAGLPLHVFGKEDAASPSSDVSGMRAKAVVETMSSESARVFLEPCFACHNSRLNAANLALDKYFTG